MLRQEDQFFPDGDGSLSFAIIMHDAIYDARPGANSELRSAMMADSIARLLTNPNPRVDIENPDVRRIWTAIHDVATAILETKDHRPTSPLGRRLCDLDLMGLGSDPDVYAQNGRNVRSECGAFTDEQRMDGRMAFLTSFLDRDHIYSGSSFQAMFESKARLNLETELASL